MQLSSAFVPFPATKKNKQQQQQKNCLCIAQVYVGCQCVLRRRQFVAVGVSTLFKTFPLYPTDKHKSPCFMIVFFSVLFGFTHILKRKNKKPCRNKLSVSKLTSTNHQGCLSNLIKHATEQQQQKKRENWLSLSATLKNRLEGWCDGREQTRNVLYVYKEQNEKGEMLSLHLVNKSRTADSVNPVRVLKTFILPCDTLYVLR